MNVIMLEIVALLMEQQPNVFVMMDFRVKIVKVSIKECCFTLTQYQTVSTFESEE